MSPSYALPADQRTRLIRSTRKLEAILGATPHVVDEPAVYLLPIGSAISTKALRREGRIFTHSASSSVSSFSSYDSISSSDFYSSESDSSRSPSPAHPLPFESSASLALFTPIPHKKSNTKSKSKLRSNVPLPRPLLLRLQAVPLPHSTVPATPLSPTILNSPTASPTPTATTFNAGDLDTQCARRRKLAKLTRTLGENVPPELVFPPGRHQNRRRSASVNLVSESSSSASAFAHRPREYEYEYGYRREQGWSGEWNNRDMEDVRKALRALKA